MAERTVQDAAARELYPERPQDRDPVCRQFDAVVSQAAAKVARRTNAPVVLVVAGPCTKDRGPHVGFVAHDQAAPGRLQVLTLQQLLAVTRSVAQAAMGAPGVPADVATVAEAAAVAVYEVEQRLALAVHEADRVRGGGPRG